MPPRVESLRARVASCRPGDFESLALDIYAYQRTANPTYARYLHLVGRHDDAPATYRDIACLPIELFRGHDVRSGTWTPAATFRSSGTTGAQTSESPVRDLQAYRMYCLRTFRELVGDPADYTLLALLPGYLEREDSGLVAMVDGFVAQAGPRSGFYLADLDGLRSAVAKTGRDGGRVLLWGVTFALLALARDAPPVLPKGSLLIETGGMKGHGPELTRTQLHAELAAAFGVPVFSEYGMTELSSQAYLTGGPRFRPAPTLRALARDLTDPLSILPAGRQGALNLYDLGNVDTCAFIATEDLGRAYPDGTFDVLGRVDRSVARGCNLLLSEIQ